MAVDNNEQNKIQGIDKSDFIEKLEKSGNAHVMMLRPHGFGKSRMIDTLFSYYDKSSLQKFNTEYAGTYIRMHPTPLKNTFRALKFVFTDLAGLKEGEFDNSFRKIIVSELEEFLKRNPDVDFVMDEDAKNDPIFALTSLCLNFSQQFPSEKIYLLIEDYDNFAYDVLFENRFDLTSNDLVTEFYDTIKSVLNVTIGRSFITGVFPIAFGNLFGDNALNTVHNLAGFRTFASVAGFNRDELVQIISNSNATSKHKKTLDELVLELEKQAGGYIFSPYDSEGLFNPRDCDAFLFGTKSKGKQEDKYQKRLNIILDLCQGIDHKEFIEKVVRGDLIKLAHVTPFLKLSIVSSYTPSDVMSLLFYLGYLSMAKDSIKKTGAVSLVCPNEHMASYFKNYYDEKKLDQVETEI